jgi:hypothetical protein
MDKYGMEVKNQVASRKCWEGVRFLVLYNHLCRWGPVECAEVSCLLMAWIVVRVLRSV